MRNTADKSDEKFERLLNRGLADEVAGRVKPIEEVGQRLIAKYMRLAIEGEEA